MDPVVLFFLLGVIARLAGSDLRLPEALYEALSIFLLITIGLKGGVELAQASLPGIGLQAIAVVLLGIVLPLAAFPVLRLRFNRFDAGAIAAHYGSVSVVTYAVAFAYLGSRAIASEPYMPVFVVLLEVPAIVVGVMLARSGTRRGPSWGPLAKEVMLGKSIVLLLGGLVIGWIAGPDGLKPISGFFFDLFKGVLALFLLEMGLVAASRARELKRGGVFLAVFAIAMPLRRHASASRWRASSDSRRAAPRCSRPWPRAPRTSRRRRRCASRCPRRIRRCRSRRRSASPFPSISRSASRCTIGSRRPGSRPERGTPDTHADPSEEDSW